MGQARAQQQMQAQPQQQSAVEQANYQGAAETPAVSAPAPAKDLTTDLQKLAELHKSGVLTDEEFVAAKKKVLG
jgi:multidrug resistance efflux pump